MVAYPESLRRRILDLAQGDGRIALDELASLDIEIARCFANAAKQLLDSHGIRYWVAEDVISFNGAPEIAEVNLGRGADAAAVQTILDSVR